ncbi:GDSL-type esterase/lipase family protein [Bacillus sp. FJAT-22090]|uniref:GDSL-type esterase/lipase family protein n=1 Tax=Bacillus sp. FJAT-22090 TaxID=1581038 RepID=UPI001643352C|nr:GDSL-type esterase/lipase family protein [Bacillus sp. FJAT-22090]
MRKILSFVLVVTLVVFSVGISTAQAQDRKIDYVALGDSLASGHTPYGEKVGRGFTDIISEELAKKDRLASFTKDYAMSGETSAGLLETLKRSEVQQSLKGAELVTIISGANDFIDEMYNPLDESINTDLTKATTLLNKVEGNLTSAIQQVKSLSPEADIYLFGYFFPLPHLEDGSSKQQLQLAFNIMNNRLATIAKSEGIHFVEVASAFDKKGASFLENPKDIHPNEAGYQVLAEQFFLNYTIPVNGSFPSLTGTWDKQFDKAHPVASNKVWTVTLNKNANPTSVAGAIYVVKNGSELIPVEKAVAKDNPRQIIVTPPKQGYKKGSYQLMITNDLVDTEGNSLKTKVLMNFKVK